MADIVTLSAGELEADFAPGAGMVGCSLRHRAEELLGERGGLSAYVERGSTFGIPLLHPWANRLSGFSYRAAGHDVSIDPDDPRLHLDGNGLPIHGLLAASPCWEVEEQGGGALRAVLDFGAHPDLLAAFPFPHRLELDVRLAASALTISTTLHATGDRAVPVSFGFHPYLRLPGVPRADWRVTLPAARHLVLDGRSIPTGDWEPFAGLADEPLGDRIFDDSYCDLAAGRFVLAGGARRLTVTFLEGYRYAQVYAPADYDAVCFEPMTAPADALRSGRGITLAEPGDSYRAAFAIEVE
ncbi:MAG: aldose 1-epimerase [Solirubrobacteraceae bacterium]|jgi:galactose mutarotase-like enzyme|nr:aldose 1-epimerase [Solirubrobacteraceae bacterium]